MKVLLLSAYDADSHKRWRKGLAAAFSDWQWTVLTLPPRYFSWRIRGNSLSWGRGETAQILKQRWDLIVTTSMTDLSALRGLVPEIVRVPTVVYFHENQFAYPVSSDAFRSVEPQLLNIYTALSGDLVLFNSEYNRSTLLGGVKKLLKRFPDCVPPGICEEIEEKSRVLPVPIEDIVFDSAKTEEAFSWDSCAESIYGGEIGQDTLIISWAARWEYDKGADRLLDILRGLKARNVKFLVNLMGQSFRNSPAEFAQIQEEFADHLLVLGYLESAKDYRQVLRHSHIFLSTAYHEFQGLAVMEAAILGATPLVPDEQCYPEFYSENFCYSDCNDAVKKLESMFLSILSGSKLKKVDLSNFSGKVIWAEYRKQFLNLVQS
ncbi:DUF3524 domain-containing protein [Microbulbifer sp. TRSA001]|uniref:tRNA-queuosine alpha-mannosyltransferase domain-containing protein n=1 Tax=unclassified Microbulbifer TaxID=2619833 RepID=UPI0024AE3882|nr:DUF3524 domain-containing protein [Microbulbifer sp. VAAF005]WHI46312.1 DUF3524 domain-containing protein [Microbulbifer sp. VAAF005]